MDELSFSTQAIEADESPDGDDDLPARESFQLIVPPLSPDAAAIRVVRDGVALLTTAIRATPPTATIQAPSVVTAGEDVVLEWTSSDADGDDLVHTVQYSQDDGATWRTLTIDAATNSLAVPRRSLPGSAQARLRVIASDGMRTATATSDVFVLDDHAPHASIHRPAEGQSYSGLQAITLQGTATDPEDGNLTDGSVSWTSDRDGLLGTGTRTGTG